MHSIEWWYFQ